MTLKQGMSVLAVIGMVVGAPALADHHDKQDPKGGAHPEHAKHEHKHGAKDCQHKAEKHGDHTDYEDGDHHHKAHGKHYDECHGPETEGKKAE